MKIFCSQCGIEKRQVNHWFIAWHERLGDRFCFTLYEMDMSLAREETVQKICGESCLHLAIQKHIEKLRLAA